MRTIRILLFIMMLSVGAMAVAATAPDKEAPKTKAEATMPLHLSGADVGGLDFSKWLILLTSGAIGIVMIAYALKNPCPSENQGKSS